MTLLAPIKHWLAEHDLLGVHEAPVPLPSDVVTSDELSEAQRRAEELRAVNKRLEERVALAEAEIQFQARTGSTRQRKQDQDNNSR